MVESIWRVERGEGPLVATAIHDGHEVRDEVHRHMAIRSQDRLREEDPFTSMWTAVAPTRVVGLRSRFEVDLNRPRETAVYRTPEDAWGLNVWREGLPRQAIRRSLEAYDGFYAALNELYSGLAATHGRFVVFDFHSYNHMRSGANQTPAPPETNPQINVGTGTLVDRSPWASLIDRFIADLSSYDFPGGKLDVRENVKFFGGNCARWTHETFPESGCVLSIEVKKFFMDEWTGTAYPTLLMALLQALESTVPGVLEELDKRCRLFEKDRMQPAQRTSPIGSFGPFATG